jgi:hypothetical protein
MPATAVGKRHGVARVAAVRCCVKRHSVAGVKAVQSCSIAACSIAACSIAREWCIATPAAVRKRYSRELVYKRYNCASQGRTKRGLKVASSGPNPLLNTHLHRCHVRQLIHRLLVRGLLRVPPAPPAPPSAPLILRLRCLLLREPLRDGAAESRAPAASTAAVTVAVGARLLLDLFAINLRCVCVCACVSGSSVDCGRAAPHGTARGGLHGGAWGLHGGAWRRMRRYRL